MYCKNKSRYFKYFCHFVIFSICLVVSGCSLDDEVSEQVYVMTIDVSSETSYDYDVLDTKKESPIECMLVKAENSETWTKLPLKAIKGFTYEKGHYYKLRIKVTRLGNPPADGAIEKYELISILSDTKE